MPRWKPLLVLLILLTAVTKGQNYQSSMNSAERAREARRYEDALRDGTYNNPMLQPSGPSLRAGDLYLQRREAEQQAIVQERQNALEARRRAEQWQAEAQRQAEVAARNREIRYAQNGMKFWGPRNVNTDPSIAQALKSYREGNLAAIATYDLLAVAESLRTERSDGMQTLANAQADEGAALLALEAWRRGQFLPAFLLTDADVATDDLRRALAYHGRLDLQRTPYYYVGWGWPTIGEYDAAQEHNLVSADQKEERYFVHALAKRFEEDTGETSDPARLFRLLVVSRLVPWIYGDLLVRPSSQQHLAHLRQSRPATGIFMTALYEDIFRYEQNRPSPWADLYYARARELTNDAFIKTFVRERLANNRKHDQEGFQAWLKWRKNGRTESLFAEVDPLVLVRVAARIILNQDWVELDHDFASLPESDAFNRRQALAHAILFDLTLQAEPHALTLQYIAAIQDETAQEPSLVAYENAVQWLLGLTRASSSLEYQVSNAAGWMETAPVSQPTSYYPDRPRLTALGFSGTKSSEDPLLQWKFQTDTVYGTYDSEWPRLDGMPLPGVISVATLLQRYAGPDLASRSRAYHDLSPRTGFAALLSQVQQVRLAQQLDSPADLFQQKRRLQDLLVGHSPPLWINAVNRVLEFERWDHIEDLVRAASAPQRFMLSWIEALQHQSPPHDPKAVRLAIAWISEGASNKSNLTETELAEWAMTARSLAQAWRAQPANEATDFPADAFTLAALAEVLVPAPAQTESLLHGYPERFYKPTVPRALDFALKSLLERAKNENDTSLLALLKPLHPESVGTIADELRGSPAKRAMETEMARAEGLLARAEVLLENPSHAELAGRVFYRAWKIGVYPMVSFPGLDKALHQLGSQPERPRASGHRDPKYLGMQADLLAAALDLREDDEEATERLKMESSLAEELWSRRSEWSSGREKRLIELLLGYSRLDEAWARKAWSQLWGNPSPAHRLAALQMKLWDLPIDHVTPAELASEPYVAAALSFSEEAVPDDPWSELESLLAATGTAAH